jgi:acyl-CoA thioester hydrolase
MELLPLMHLTPNRFYRSSYPHCFEIASRLADVDINGHLNNCAIAAIYEEARVQLHTLLFGQETIMERGSAASVVTDVQIMYLLPATYPQALSVFTAVSSVLEMSYVVSSALYQDERCTGFCDARMMRVKSGKAIPLDSDYVNCLSTLCWKQTSRTSPETPC